MYIYIYIYSIGIEDDLHLGLLKDIPKLLECLQKEFFPCSIIKYCWEVLSYILSRNNKNTKLKNKTTVLKKSEKDCNNIDIITTTNRKITTNVIDMQNLNFNANCHEYYNIHNITQISNILHMKEFILLCEYIFMFPGVQYR